jgi:hypothetical protein
VHVAERIQTAEGNHAIGGEESVLQIGYEIGSPAKNRLVGVALRRPAPGMCGGEEPKVGRPAWSAPPR